jgi:hypothetical protein
MTCVVCGALMERSPTESRLLYVYRNHLFTVHQLRVVLFEHDHDDPDFRVVPPVDEVVH